MHKTSQVESSSVLLLKPNLRIELYILYLYKVVKGLFCAMIEITIRSDSFKLTSRKSFRGIKEKCAVCACEYYRVVVGETDCAWYEITRALIK